MGTKEKLTAEQVREQFPECVAFADEVRNVFGDDVKMVYARENGREIGKLSARPGDNTVRGDQLVIGSALSDSVVAKRGK